ncbi:MAG: hypothetical protein ACREUQ_08600 [Burkholderiales bacterium]
MKSITSALTAALLAGALATPVFAGTPETSTTPPSSEAVPAAAATVEAAPKMAEAKPAVKKHRHKSSKASTETTAAPSSDPKATTPPSVPEGTN